MSSEDMREYKKLCNKWVSLTDEAQPNLLQDICRMGALRARLFRQDIIRNIFQGCSFTNAENILDEVALINKILEKVGTYDKVPTSKYTDDMIAEVETVHSLFNTVRHRIAGQEIVA